MRLLIGLRTAPMGPDASWERPWGAPEQADEVLIARSHTHPLTPPAASRAEMTAGPATSPNARATAVGTGTREAPSQEQAAAVRVCRTGRGPRRPKRRSRQ